MMTAPEHTICEQAGRNRLFFCFLLLLITWTVYSGILDHDFLSDWDDPIYVTENETIRGFSLEHLKTAFSSLYMGNYAPVQMLSYMADHAFWGLNPTGFKLTNLILHMLNGMMFYLLLIRLTNQTAPAFFAALLFLCHPVQVESVAWISQRKNLLAMFFFLVALHLYRSCHSQTGRHRNRYYYGALASFLLSLFAKPVTVIFPIVMVFYDICFEEGKERNKSIRDLRPFIVIAGLFAMLSFFFQSPEYQGGKTTYHGGTPLATLYTMLTVVMKYLKNIFWPVDLSAGYFTTIITSINLQVTLSFLVILILAIFGWWLFKHKRELLFWYALFYIGLLPVSQIVPMVTMMNDRYLYFPMLGVAAFMVFTASSIRFQIPAFRLILLGISALVIIPLAAEAHQRTEVWKNSLTLWDDTVHKMPQAAIAWAGLGNACLNAGRIEEAVGHYRRALLLDPDNRTAQSNLERLYHQAHP